ncbi:T9SS type A sorting domain-containing protein [Hymenobacter gummosus]|uniref:T9SS type A sorting domain-containing protein n=1 Tax=Hymenobacter gummosus TaxID=1776032 RepID=A0A3S0H2Y0_9BACT|nr:peptide-N-glycosidase F-related protein [Hymenobacter gummosus]RTQ47232.1 T9SS type A sorting domain-containing protein [Hymenobacter gummosus]
MLKRLLLFLLLLAGGLAAPTVRAATGDTTRVTVFNNRALTRYGEFDTTATFPAAGRYRKILLHYVLGRYACPPGSQYCGSWDYTTRVVLLPPANDTVELARIITPYATDWLAQNRRHDYVVDVTDYASLLRGTNTLRFFYDGYSWGFNITMYLEFIEGTPPRDALGVKNVYSSGPAGGGFPYGRLADPIDNYLPAKTVTAVPGAAGASLKSFITGHGADTRNCAEFCRKFYTLFVNGTSQGNTDLWRADCGLNQIYPQTGTWVYNRSNWCPGNAVAPIYHDLTSALSGGSAQVNIDMAPHAISNQSMANAKWIWQTQLVSYSAPNFTTDAALEQIVAPTTDANFVRDNPICDAPRVVLRNTGSAPLTTATIRYRVGTNAWRSYQWTGSLAFLAQTEVTLPPVPADFTGQSVFRVYVTAPNGQADQNHYNDSLRTRFNAVSMLPPSFVVSLLTNNSVTAGVGQTSWTLTDQAGQTLSSRTNTTPATTYTDTLRLAPGCYTLTVDDAGCDGLSWWANTAGGTGIMRLLGPNNTVLRTINGDFGCQYKLRFSVTQALARTPAQALAALDVYPNPAQDGRFTLDLNLPVRQDVQLQVLSATGQRVYQATLPQVQAVKRPLDLHQLPAGVYLLECRGQNGLQLHRRLLIP